MIQLFVSSTAADDDQIFIGFLRYILSLTVEPQTQGGVIPNILVRLGTKTLGTFELMGTRYNSLTPETAPNILNNWLNQKIRVDPKWGQGGQDEIAWAILAQVLPSVHC